MSIPALIVPILNRPDLLDRMLASIDHPVERVIVIDNGDVVDPNLGGRTLSAMPIRVIQPGCNLGVAASWNLGIKCSASAPWWLIANNDIEFGPGDLARLETAVEPRANAIYYTLGMAGFALTPPAIQSVGWFDENIHPAYDEDLDWQRRARLIGVKEVDTGFTGSHFGSATIMSDPYIRMQNGATHGANDRYYAAKWGGEKAGGETYLSPFNKGGAMGDWTLDISRLRAQAWKR